jgi:hypothetical protein
MKSSVLRAAFHKMAASPRLQEFQSARAHTLAELPFPAGVDSVCREDASMERRQAFVVNRQSVLRRAVALKQVRETGMFENFGLSLEQYCKESPAAARRPINLIRQYWEFGEVCCRLSWIVSISRESGGSPAA